MIILLVDNPVGVIISLTVRLVSVFSGYLRKSCFVIFSVFAMEDIIFPIGNDYELYTGSCHGADEEAERMGLEMGFKVHIKIGPQHPRSQNVTPLTQEELLAAEPFLMRANETLKRKLLKLDMSHSPYYRELLQRNYHIIKDVTHVYVFGQLEDSRKTLKGGTGWTVHLALDTNKTVYVYLVRNLVSTISLCLENRISLVGKNFQFQPLGNTTSNQCIQTPPIYQPNQRSLPVLHKASAVVGLALFLTEAEKKSELCLEEHSTWKKKCKV